MRPSTHYIVVLDDRRDSYLTKNAGLLQRELYGQVQAWGRPLGEGDLITVAFVGFGRREPRQGCPDPPGPVDVQLDGLAQPFPAGKAGEAKLAQMILPTNSSCRGRAESFSPWGAPLVALERIGELLRDDAARPPVSFAQTVIVVATAEPAAEKDRSLPRTLSQGISGDRRFSPNRPDENTQKAARAALETFDFSAQPTRRTFDVGSLRAIDQPIRDGQSEGPLQRYWEWRPTPKAAPPPPRLSRLDGARVALEIPEQGFRPARLRVEGRNPVDVLECRRIGACRLALPNLVIDEKVLGGPGAGARLAVDWRHVPGPGGSAYAGTIFGGRTVELAAAPTPAQVPAPAQTTAQAEQPRASGASAVSAPPPSRREAVDAVSPWPIEPMYLLYLFAGGLVTFGIAKVVISRPTVSAESEGRTTAPPFTDDERSPPPRSGRRPPPFQVKRGERVVEVAPNADATGGTLALTITRPETGGPQVLALGIALVSERIGPAGEPWCEARRGQDLVKHQQLSSEALAGNLEIGAGAEYGLFILPGGLALRSWDRMTAESVDVAVGVRLRWGTEEQDQETYEFTLRFRPAPAPMPEIGRPVAVPPAVAEPRADGTPRLLLVTRPRPSETKAPLPVATLTISQPPANRFTAPFKGLLRPARDSALSLLFEQVGATGGAKLLLPGGKSADVELPAGAELVLGIVPAWRHYAPRGDGAEEDEVPTGSLVLQDDAPGSVSLPLEIELPALLIRQPATRVVLALISPQEGEPAEIWELIGPDEIDPKRDTFPLPDVVVEAHDRSAIDSREFSVTLEPARPDERVALTVRPVVPAGAGDHGLRFAVDGLAPEAAMSRTLRDPSWGARFWIEVDPTGVAATAALTLELRLEVEAVLFTGEVERARRAVAFTRWLKLLPGARRAYLCIDFGTSAIAATFWNELGKVEPIDLQHQPVGGSEMPAASDLSLYQKDSSNTERSERGMLLPSYVGLGAAHWLYPNEEDGERLRRLEQQGRHLNVALPFAPFDELTQRFEEVVYAPKSQLGRLKSAIAVSPGVPVREAGLPAGEGLTVRDGKLQVPVPLLLREAFQELRRAYLWQEKLRQGRLVLTAPNTFGPRHRASLLKAARGLAEGLEVEPEYTHVVSESDAAAFHFLRKERHAGPGRKRVLLYDLGAGTLDLSLIETERDDTGRLTLWRVLDRFGAAVAGNALDEEIARAVHEALLGLAADGRDGRAGKPLLRYDAERWLVRGEDGRKGENEDEKKKYRDHAERVMAFHSSLQLAKIELSEKLVRSLGSGSYGWQDHDDIGFEVEVAGLDGAFGLALAQISEEECDATLSTGPPGRHEPWLVKRDSLKREGKALFLRLPQVWLAERLGELIDFLTRDMIDALVDRARARGADLERDGIDTLILSGRAALWPMFHDQLRPGDVTQLRVGEIRPPASAAEMKEAVVAGAVALTVATEGDRGLRVEDRGRRHLAVEVTRYGYSGVELHFEEDWGRRQNWQDVASLSLYEVVSRQLWESFRPSHPWREHLRTALGFNLILTDDDRSGPGILEWTGSDEPGRVRLKLGAKRFDVEADADARAPQLPWPLRSIFLEPRAEAGDADGAR